MSEKDPHLAEKEKISVQQYLEEVAELAMLACPTAEELQELRRAVAIMTPAERQNAETLSDEQIERIAADARIDRANLAIFFNGYALTCKRVS